MESGAARFRSLTRQRSKPYSEDASVRACARHPARIRSRPGPEVQTGGLEVRRALVFPVLSVVGGIVAACGSASTATHAAATTSSSPAPVTVTVTTPTTTPDVLHPRHHRKRRVATATTTTPTPTRTNPPAGPSPSAPANVASVDAVTDDGAVLTLDDGGVYSVDSGDQSTTSSWSQGDSVTVSDSQDAIFNASTGEKVSVTYVDDATARNSYPGGGDASIEAKSDDGSIIVLDDGSIWIVAPYDRPTSAIWLDVTSITVNDSGDQLVDTDDQETVDANYIGDA